MAGPVAVLGCVAPSLRPDNLVSLFRQAVPGLALCRPAVHAGGVEGELPADLRRFIARHIVSVEELEVLLLLQEERARDWSAAEVNARMRSQESSIAKWLGVLEALGLVSSRHGRFRFAPATPDLEEQIAALAAAYRDRRIRVIESIFSKTNENLLSFARAFDLRRAP